MLLKKELQKLVMVWELSLDEIKIRPIYLDNGWDKLKNLKRILKNDFVVISY